LLAAFFLLGNRGTRAIFPQSPTPVRPPSLKFAASLACLATALVFGATRAAAQDPSRFSQTLSVAERTECALTKLSSDQIAVIDALVRRDTATRSGTAPAPETPTAFSQRLTADERKATGLPSLTPAEVAKIDAFVERYQSARLARTLLAPPSFLTPQRTALRESDTRKPKERELHGTFSLSMGWGSGGYSEKTGAMSVTLEDPAKGYSITIGYSETHVKGGPLIYRDPYYDLPRGPIDDPLRP
jgi:hypothetical protein